MGIFHNHGIPQGPLPSGLVSEVVLSHFDSLKSRGVDFHYFRYVDDIRLFAKNERDLRRLLVKLDLLSKDIGLFPQSGKIRIHRVKNIEDELKSLSKPTESAIKRKRVDQMKLLKRIKELTPRFAIADATRFKYLLAHADPSSELTARLWRVLEMHPEVYTNVCNYLRRYPKLPHVPAERIVEVVRANTLYHSVQAEFIGVADGRLPPAWDDQLANYLRVQWSPSSMDPDLLARVGTYLMRTGHLTARQVEHACSRARSWWTRATLIDNLDLIHVGTATRDRIVQKGLRDDARDVALAAGWTAFMGEVSLTGSQKYWNRSGSILLREVGLIKRASGYCGISMSFQKLDPKMPTVSWKRLLSAHYTQAERQAVDIVALSQTNITAFVNALDVFNDILLDALFKADGTIGSYTLGEIGAVLGFKTSRFASKYPATFALASQVHEARLSSMYSHPRVRKTSKPTKRIRYRFLGNAKRVLRSAASELCAAGH